MLKGGDDVDPDDGRDTRQTLTRYSRLPAYLRQFVGRNLTRGFGDGVGAGRRGRLRWRRHRDGCRCRLRRRRVDRGGRASLFAAVGGLDDRFLGDRCLDKFLGGRLPFRIGRGLDGFLVICWVVIQLVVNVVDVIDGLIDAG